MTKINLSIPSNHDRSDEQARAEAALNAFIAKHKLSDEQVIAIWQDSDHPLFNELDSGISLAATEGWHDPNGFEGYELRLS